MRFRHTYPISALYERTHAEPQGPFVCPAQYEVRLTVDGKTYKQPLTVEMDPRVKITQAALQQQFDFAQKIDSLITLSYDLHENAAKLLEGSSRTANGAGEERAGEAAALQAVTDFDAKALKIQGEQQRGFGGGGKPKPTFTLMNSELAYLSETVNKADAAPTDAMHVAYHDYCQDLTKVAQQWTELIRQDSPAISNMLMEQHVQPLPMIIGIPTVPPCAQ